ncbi:hypothetical protein IQ267_10245 [filamentous cyanobacterium LEGE 07170]|nr:hypothetical protein [filamentous cyanobacterium LEGE 07170]
MPTSKASKTDNLFAKLLNNVGLAALAAVAIALPACTIPAEPEAADPEATIEENAAGVEEDNVTVEELTDNLEAYLGETVSVREEIAEVVGEYSFTLENSELFGGEQVLVINASEQGLELVDGEDTQVQVTGEVREFLMADFESDYGLGFDPDIFGEYEERPVIVAQSVALSPDPADISSDPEQYYNKRIAVEGEVGSIQSANVITIDDETLFGGEELLVISPQVPVAAQEDETVVITGVLRPFVLAEFEQDYDLTWDLDVQQQIEAEYENRPVFIADEIYPSAL